eukprot:10499468-Alexandrium_andersonii.AAC.1
MARFLYIELTELASVKALVRFFTACSPVIGPVSAGGIGPPGAGAPGTAGLPRTGEAAALGAAVLGAFAPLPAPVGAAVAFA